MANRWVELLDRIVTGELTGMPPFLENLNLPPLVRWEPGRVWMEWDVDKRYFHAHAAVFGGYLAAIADRGAAVATMTVLEHNEGFTTSDLRTSFFRPVGAGRLIIDGRVIHRGRSMAHIEIDFMRDDGKLACRSTATQVIIPYRDPVPVE